jgi:hypothetical protein
MTMTPIRFFHDLVLFSFSLSPTFFLLIAMLHVQYPFPRAGLRVLFSWFVRGQTLKSFGVRKSDANVKHHSISCKTGTAFDVCIPADSVFIGKSNWKKVKASQVNRRQIGRMIAPKNATFFSEQRKMLFQRAEWNKIRQQQKFHSTTRVMHVIGCYTLCDKHLEAKQLKMHLYYWFPQRLHRMHCLTWIAR